MGGGCDHRTIFGTYNDFVREVPLDDWRSILVHRREHGHREFIRIRTWNQHRLWGAWYPTKRTFVIPIDEAMALADAIYAGVVGEFSEEPEWVSKYQPNSSWFEDSGR